jgi:protein-disulfide isomerase
LIVDEVIRQEATRRAVAIDDLRKQASTDVTIDEAAVTQYLEANAQQFRVMEPDLAREAARAIVLNRAKIAKYGELIRDLRTRAAINITLAEPAPIMVDVDPARGFALGPATAPVSIVQFSDYQCPYCARLHPVLDEIVTEYAGKVRLVMRDFPLSTHAQASSAAGAARCAGEQGKFWEYHRALFQPNAAIDAQTFDTLANRFKLDLTRFHACRASEQTAAAIKADVAEGEKIGVRGTPTMVVNGKLVRGARSKQDLQRIIDAALREPATAGGGQP